MKLAHTQKIELENGAVSTSTSCVGVVRTAWEAS